MHSGAPAADRILIEGPGRGVLQTARAISQLAPAGIPAVLRDAFARAWFGKPAWRSRPRFDFLTGPARELAGSRPVHPWLTCPSGTLPGKAVHVRDLAYFKAYVESLDPRSTVPIVAPLLSQPLVEACLRIPTWLWFESGLNRMVARRAFTGLLPPDILSRRSKGTPSSFNFEILETHHQTIRDMLVDGQLARQGLIDLPGLLSVLDPAHPASDAVVERVLALIDVEAWAAGWTSFPHG
jgi:asparagine synthase (glutamine-hydrolysing)